MMNCSKCNKSWSDDYQCCPMCGEDLVSDSGHYNVRMGSSNAISGGVHSSDNHAKSNSDNVTDSNNETHTNSHNTTNNTTNNTTIIEVEKSESEKLKENEREYRLRCKELYKGGLISSEGELLLRELQYSLNLPDELALPIRNEIKLLSKKRQNKLSLAGMSDIRQTKSIIEQNTAPALQRQLLKLESWIKEYDDNTLNLMYYQMSSMLEPIRYTNRYEDSPKDEYWEAYWAYIAYMLQNREREANEALASLGRWHRYYPEQNDMILHIVGLLIQNFPIDDIQEVRSSLTDLYTADLQLLVDAIDELLDKNWEMESVMIRPAHSFYIKTLFIAFVETQKASGAERMKAKREHEARQKQAEQQRIHEQELAKQAALKAKAEAEAEAKRLEKELQEKENRRQAEIAYAAKEAETRHLKQGFIKSFEINDCDLLKTCSDVGISTATYRSWRNTDPVFSDKVAYLQKVHDEKAREKQCIELRANLKKALPFVLAAVMVVIIGYSGYRIIDSVIEKRVAEDAARAKALAYEEAQQAKYDSLKLTFDAMLDKVKKDDAGAQYVENASDILSKIRSFEGNYDTLYAKLKDKIDTLYQYYKKKSTPIIDDPTRWKEESDKYKALMKKLNDILNEKI